MCNDNYQTLTSDGAAERQTVPAPFAPYRLLRLVGQGAMARVFLANHERLGRRAALKLLHPEHACRPDLVSLFFAEARAANRIKHPAIIEITDFVHRPDATYLIMEYLRGHSLAEELRGGPLPLRRALGIARQIAAGLAAAHDAGIVHRDLKPENIFIQEPGCRVKVLDFGVAKFSDATVREQYGEVRLSGLVVGTPRYMSPEQARGEPVSERTDIYSLGVILYEMLSGRVPFGGAAARLLGHTLFLEPTPLGPLRSGAAAPPALEALLRRCLACYPGQRIQRMDELEHEISRILASCGAVKRPRRQVARDSSWARAAVLTMAGVLAAALPLGVALLEGSAEQRREAESVAATVAPGTLPSRALLVRPPARHHSSLRPSGEVALASDVQSMGHVTDVAQRASAAAAEDVERSSARPRDPARRPLHTRTIDPFVEAASRP